MVVTKMKCSLCEHEFKYKHWWDEDTKGLEKIRMRLCLCEQCYYAFKGDRIMTGDGLEYSEGERCLLMNVIHHEMNSLCEYIMKRWRESYYVTSVPGPHFQTSRIQKFTPDDMVLEQRQLFTLMNLFKKIRSGKK